MSYFLFNVLKKSVKAEIPPRRRTSFLENLILSNLCWRPGGWPTDSDNSPETSIHILDDNSLFSLLCLHQSFLWAKVVMEIINKVPTDGRMYGSAEGGGINWHMFLMMAKRHSTSSVPSTTPRTD